MHRRKFSGLIFLKMFSGFFTCSSQGRPTCGPKKNSENYRKFRAFPLSFWQTVAQKRSTLFGRKSWKIQKTMKISFVHQFVFSWFLLGLRMWSRAGQPKIALWTAFKKTIIFLSFPGFSFAGKVSTFFGPQSAKTWEENFRNFRWFSGFFCWSFFWAAGWTPLAGTGEKFWKCLEKNQPRKFSTVQTFSSFFFADFFHRLFLEIKIRICVRKRKKVQVQCRSV